VLQCQISEFLVYLFADPLVPVHDRSSILHPQSLHLPMIAAGRSACLPGGRSELPTLSPWQLFQAKYLRHSCMYFPTSVLHPCCRLRLHDVSEVEIPSGSQLYLAVSVVTNPINQDNSCLEQLKCFESPDSFL
jgi:hypothetical protein